MEDAHASSSVHTEEDPTDLTRNAMLIWDTNIKKGQVSEHLSKGLAFVRSQPRATCIIVRLSFEQLRLYFAGQFEVMSATWEHTHRVEQVRRLRKTVAGVPFADVPKADDRWHGLTLAAHNVLENKFHRNQATLFDEAMWLNLLMKSDLTLENNLFAFQMVSGIDANIRHMITEVNARELKIFRLEREPELAGKILEEPRCRHKEWTAAHVKLHRGKDGGLLNPDAVQTRRQMSRITPMDLHCSFNLHHYIGLALSENHSITLSICICICI